MCIEEFNGYSNKPTRTLTIWLETDESLKNYWRHKSKSLPEDELPKELQSLGNQSRGFLLLKAASPEMRK